MKAPELKKYLQVWGISVVNKCHKELLELAIKIVDEEGDEYFCEVGNEQWNYS